MIPIRSPEVAGSVQWAFEKAIGPPHAYWMAVGMPVAPAVVGHAVRELVVWQPR